MSVQTGGPSPDGIERVVSSVGGPQNLTTDRQHVYGFVRRLNPSHGA